MAEVVSLKTGHPLVGTWRDANDESGTSVRFTIRATGQGFDVAGVDASDGEVLSISNVRWDGRALRFDSFVPSNGHRVEYAFELVSPSEIRVRSRRRSIGFARDQQAANKRLHPTAAEGAPGASRMRREGPLRVSRRRRLRRFRGPWLAKRLWTLQSVVELRFFIDPATGQPHINGHDVTEDEVEDVLSRPIEDRPGAEGSRVALGQTEGGRYLKVIYVPDPAPDSLFVITAYDLGPKALKALRRRRKK